MYNTMNLYYKYTSIPKSSLNKLILPINTEEKYLKYSIHFASIHHLPAITNLIFQIVRLENLMTSCKNKLCHHTISNKIEFSFLIILFSKMSSSKSLPSSGTESEIERMTDFEKFSL